MEVAVVLAAARLAAPPLLMHYSYTRAHLLIAIAHIGRCVAP